MRESYLHARRSVNGELPASCSRTVLLGEDNPQSLNLYHALYPMPVNCAGWRLQNKILEVPEANYLGTWRANLCPSGTWNLKEADHSARMMMASKRWDNYVLCGAKVSSVFSKILGLTLGPFTSTATRLDVGYTVRLLAIPHPSGRSRQWNEPGSAERARQLLMDAGVDLWHLDSAENVRTVGT